MVEQILPATVLQAVVSKQGTKLLGPIDLEIGESGFTIVMGPNGAGKTTLLKLLHGLERLKSGTVDWACPRSIAQKHQAFVFQSPVMLRRSVRENLVYPLKLNRIGRTQIAKTASSWLARIKLEDKVDMPAHFLSGGEKQKLALARALVTDPQILFLDEPTANLDGSSTKEIEQILSDVAGGGLRVIMTTHDVAQAKRLADDVVFLYRGEIIESGDARTFFETPAATQAKAFLNGEIVE